MKKTEEQLEIERLTRELGFAHVQIRTLTAERDALSKLLEKVNTTIDTLIGKLPKS